MKPEQIEKIVNDKLPSVDEIGFYMKDEANTCLGEYIVIRNLLQFHIQKTIQATEQAILTHLDQPEGMELTDEEIAKLPDIKTVKVDDFVQALFDTAANNRKVIAKAQLRADLSVHEAKMKEKDATIAGLNGRIEGLEKALKEKR